MNSAEPDIETHQNCIECIVDIVGESCELRRS